MDALESLLEQTVPPKDVIIVDDSTTDEIKVSIEENTGRFRARFINLRYCRNTGRRSLPKSRNIGVEIATGDIVLFLDDDVLLDSHYIENIIRVYESHPEAMGVQGYWGTTTSRNIGARLTNFYNRVFCLWQYRKNRCIVLPSFEPVYPRPLTETITCQWLSGCNQSYPMEIFKEFRFDDKLMGYAPGGEDIDFSFRLHSRYKGTLFITPEARLIHRASPTSRTVNRTLVLMRSVYKQYFFCKNIKPTIKNEIAFAWSVLGSVLYAAGINFYEIVGRRRFNLKYLHETWIAQLFCLEHREQIRKGDLDFLLEFLRL
jgi:GT2 family glycosyltransferase